MSDKVEAKLLHCMRRAIHDYHMLEAGDRVMVCLSGGKDSYTLFTLLQNMVRRAQLDVELFVFVLDQSQPGWDDADLRAWLDEKQAKYEILTRNTYGVVKEKIPPGKSTCSLCSRLRRGNIYQYARTHGFNKIALGHHRDDLIQTLLMSIFYNGKIRSMPPKLRSDDGENTVIRPLAYCQEADIIRFAKTQQFPIIPCNLCGTQTHLMRDRVARLIKELSEENSKVPSNILHALQSVTPSHLMDKQLHDFKSMRSRVVLSDDAELIGV